VGVEWTSVWLRMEVDGRYLLHLLGVQSEHGAGRWIIATLPLGPEILSFQRPGIVSRY